MRSFIEEISVAEQEAEKIRQDAVDKAKEMVSAASLKATETLEHLKETERERTKEALQQAEKDGEAEAVKKKHSYEENAESICREAEKKLDDTVSYLLNKIQGLA